MSQWSVKMVNRWRHTKSTLLLVLFFKTYLEKETCTSTGLHERYEVKIYFGYTGLFVLWRSKYMSGNPTCFPWHCWGTRLKGIKSRRQMRNPKWNVTKPSSCCIICKGIMTKIHKMLYFMNLLFFSKSNDKSINPGIKRKAELYKHKCLDRFPTPQRLQNIPFIATGGARPSAGLGHVCSRLFSDMFVLVSSVTSSMGGHMTMARLTSGPW